MVESDYVDVINQVGERNRLFFSGDINCLVCNQVEPCGVHNFKTKGLGNTFLMHNIPDT